MPFPSLAVAALTDRGQVRPGNEDAAGAFEHATAEACLIIVADGLGGLKDGAYASQLALDAASDAFLAAQGDLVAPVEEALLQVNHHLFERADGDEARLSGTTVTAIVIEPERAVVLHAGDSRAYRLRGHNVEPLTRDHSWVNEQVGAGLMSPEQAARSPQRNIITRCLGVEPDVELDRIVIDPPAPGEALLVSTDGLHGVLTNTDIAAVLTRAAGPSEACKQLVQRANDAGGPDNVGVALARLTAT